MASPTVHVNLGGLQVLAHGEYTANEVGTFFDEHWRNIVSLYTSLTDIDGNYIPGQPDDPEQAVFDLWLNLSALVDGAQNGIDSETGLPVVGGQPEGRQFFFTVEMVNSLDRLLKSVEASGLTVNDLFGPTPITPAQIVERLQTWSDLGAINVKDILVDMGQAIRSNRTLQALIETDYIKVGNEMIGNQLDKLDEALRVTKNILDLMTTVQELKNKIQPEEKTKAQVYYQNVNSPDGVYTGDGDDDQLIDFIRETLFPGFATNNPSDNTPPYVDEDGNVYDGQNLSSINDNDTEDRPDDVTKPYEALMRRAFGLPLDVNFDLVTAEDVAQFQNVKVKLAGYLGQLYQILGVDQTTASADKPPIIRTIETLLADMNPPTVSMDVISYVDVYLRKDVYSDAQILAAHPSLALVPDDYLYDNAGGDINIVTGLFDGGDPVPQNYSSDTQSVNMTVNVDDYTAYRLYFPTGANVQELLDGVLGNVGGDYISSISALLFNPNVPGDVNNQFLRNQAIDVLQATRNAFIKFPTLMPETSIDVEGTDNLVIRDGGWIFGRKEIIQMADTLNLNGASEENRKDLLTYLTITSAQNSNQKFNVDMAMIPPEYNPQLLAYKRWLADNYPNADVVDAGVFQRHVTEAITASQNLNDTQKEDLRRFMYLFEQFYKSASAVLEAIDRMVARMAQNIKG